MNLSTDGLPIDPSLMIVMYEKKECFLSENTR